jgi:hypothetical protein
VAILKNTVFNDTGFVRLPIGNDAQRPAVAAGKLRYNTTSGTVEVYNTTDSLWIPTIDRGVIATGGTAYDIDIEGTTYRVHVFTIVGNSIFTVSRGGSVEYLVVAGGGGGTGNFFDDGGGGGAGGLLTGIATVASQSYTITVGNGAAASDGQGVNGGNSVALGLTALGGGSGAGHRSSGAAGGSGGGAGGSFVGDNSVNAGGAATQPGSANGGFGNAGGNGSVNGATVNGGGYPGSGGGGGAGSVGRHPFGGGAGQGGTGGQGIVSNITGLQNFYAGGGGGLLGGAGGIGGGANATAGRGGSPGIAATANTGGGGGGGRASGDTGSPSAGGAGIVIIRYPLKQANPVTVPGRVVDNGLILDLDFSKPTVYAGSSTVVSDSRFNGLGGTITGTVPFLNFGTHRSAMRGNITAGNSIILNPRCIAPGNEISLVFWNFGKTQQVSSIISGTTGSAQDLNIHLPWSDGNVYWDCGSPFNRIAFNISAIYLGWRHWVFTHNANTGIKRIYNNGVEVSSGGAQTSSIPTLTSLRLGEGWTGTSYGHNGDIGLFSSYNREISATEISQLYNATRWRFGI